MIHFIFSDKEPNFLFLKGDYDYDELHLESFLQYCNLIDPICFLPMYKKTGKAPFTQDFVFKYMQRSGKTIYYTYIGLWQEAYKFFKENDFEFTGLIDHEDVFKVKLKHSYKEFKEIVRSWHLSLDPYEYQLQAAYKILQWKQSLSLLSTRAGKTLIAYIIFRYEMEYMHMKKILMIVPSIQLVNQGYNDFKEYAEFFNTECIWANGNKIAESDKLTIGTFQSLIKFIDRKSKKYNPSFFDGYDCVFVDEAHRATANQIKTIITQPFMKNVKIAFGMTGTLPEKHTIPYYCLHSLLGAKIQDIEPKALMDAGYISKIDIHQIRLHYNGSESIARQAEDAFIRCAEYSLSSFIMEPDLDHPGKKKRVPAVKQENQILWQKNLSEEMQSQKESILKDHSISSKAAYIKFLKSKVSESEKCNMLVIERMMTHFMQQRIEYACSDIIPKCTKNTLILAHHTAYIKKISDIISSKFPDRHVMTIIGAVNLKDREKIVSVLKEHNNCILIASYGTMSTGITLPNLCYGILFESFKSNIVNMQSLGRGLGLSKLKTQYEVYDIIDCFDSENLGIKALYLQGLAKIKLYKENHYKYNIKNVSLS